MKWTCPTKYLEIGVVYQFNAALAKIVQLSYEEVVWVAPRRRGINPRHRVPRWYFEKYSNSHSKGARTPE